MDMVLMALLKKYVNDSLVGVGALKGAPCTIKSIAEITGGNRITFSWVDDEETERTSTLDVMDGEKGDKGDKGDAGDDYVLTAQDKSDIADLVLAELPSAEGLEV